MSAGVSYTRKVRYSDSDAQGHVFNVNYFVYFDDAITDWMEAAVGTSHLEDGYDIFLAHAECDFKSPAHLGDTLVTSVRVEKIGNTSLVFALETREEGDGRLVVTGREIYVTVDRTTHKPITVPAKLRDACARIDGHGG